MNRFRGSPEACALPGQFLLDCADIHLVERLVALHRDGGCNPGATYASGFGFFQTANITAGVRTGQIVARFRF